MKGGLDLNAELSALLTQAPVRASSPGWDNLEMIGALVAGAHSRRPADAGPRLTRNLPTA
jgi:hypothetical protein